LAFSAASCVKRPYCAAFGVPAAALIFGGAGVAAARSFASSLSIRASTSSPSSLGDFSRRGCLRAADAANCSFIFSVSSFFSKRLLQSFGAHLALGSGADHRESHSVASPLKSVHFLYLLLQIVLYL
jgi:hypothetical protein